MRDRLRKWQTDLMRAIAAVGVCALAGCHNEASMPGPLTIIASGNTAGRIVPCGCTSNQSGGLLRRATFVDRTQQETTTLIVDVGGAPSGNSPYDRAKFEAILEGERLMGIAAHNIGAAEAALGEEYFDKLGEISTVPFLSTNLTDSQGNYIAEKTLIGTYGNRRVLILGVIDPSLAPEPFRAAPPESAVLDAIAAAPPHDVVLLLAYAPENKLRTLAESLPEVDILIGGPTGQPIQPEQIGPVLLISSTNQAKFLAVIEWKHDPYSESDTNEDSPTARIVELDESFADNQRQVDNLTAFRKQLTDRDFKATETSFVPTGQNEEDRIAGNDACKSCHEEEFDLWRRSSHHDAWASLESKNAMFDPDCQRCHVTGYGLSAGFISAGTSPNRVDVGCESCHGPSSRHAADEKLPTPRKGIAAYHCTTCHDHENSPRFDYDTYWKKIAHGEE